MKISRTTVAALTLFGLLTGATLSSTMLTPAPASANTYTLTDTGEQSLQQLRACLAETPVLNAYYLIDQSGSLYAGNPWDPTDPDFRRIPILQKSLAQLASLSTSEEPISVNYASGFFGNDVVSLNAWTPLTESNLAEQQQALQEFIFRGPLGQTNWTAGLRAAEQQLANPTTPGCSLMIWLTDGQIDLGNATDSWQALADLCGLPVTSQDPAKQFTPAAPGGLFKELRTSGVTVVGVYLNPEEPSDRAAWMQSLIEANDETGNKPCGNGEISKAERAGAFINARTTSDLAFQLTRLGEIVRGASDGTINADGTFLIEPGVTSFKIISQAPLDSLSLLSPRGIPSDAPIEREQIGETAQLTVTLTSKTEFGKWTLVGADNYANALLLYGDLKVVASPLLVNSSNTEGHILVQFSASNEKIQNFDDYSFDLIATTVIDGKTETLATVSSSEMTGGSTIIDIPNPQTLGVVKIRVKNLKAGEQALSDSLRTLDYATYPSVVHTTDLGLARGQIEPATGTMTFFGPQTGNGQICVDTEKGVQVINDDAARDDWQISGLGENSTECFAITQNQTLEIPVQATSNTSANSANVTLGLPLTVTSDTSSTTLPATTELKFGTQVINNPFVYWSLVALLILLAAVIPLIVLYVINKLTTKVEHGDAVVKALLPVKISTKDDKILVRERPEHGFTGALNSLEKPQELFKMQPPQPDAKTINDFDAGIFKAVVPLFPLTAPWFEIVAPDGHVILTGTTPNTLKERRYATGRKAPFNGQISRTWAIIADEHALLTAGDEPFEAKLVIFDKRGRGTIDRPQQRLLEVHYEAKLSSRFSRLREHLITHSKKAQRIEQSSKPTPANDTIGLPPMPLSGGAPGIVPAPPMPKRNGTKTFTPGTSTSPPGSPPPPPGSQPTPPPPPPLPGKR